MIRFASVAVVTVVVSAASLLGAACADEATCDEGQEFADGNCVCLEDYSLKDNRCVPNPPVMPPPDDAGGGDAICAAVDFGTPCTDDVNHSECGCPADYCAVSPFGVGYCTVTGCLEDPSVCPSGWTCMDLGVFMAGLPSICSSPD